MRAQNTDNEIQKLGMTLQWCREAVGMSRAELAEKVGTRYDVIRMYETGDRIMKVDRLFRILDVLGVRLSDDFVLRSPNGRQIEYAVYQEAVRINDLPADVRRNLLNRIHFMVGMAEEGGG